MDNSLIVDDLNIAELGDDELLERLKNLGFNPGPILGSTREVYQRKLARLLRNEDYGDSEEGSGGDEPIVEVEANVVEGYRESPILNSTYESGYSGSPSFNVDDLRRRPLSRVEGEQWSNSPPTLSPHKPWSPDDIVSQVQPPPGEEEKPLVSSTTIAVIVVVFFVFALLVFYNMESTPQTPFS